MEVPPPATPPPEPTKPPDEHDLDAELLADPHALQILTTEHWSLLSARGLAYNESFTRANMYLAFVSMSFVALALIAQATGFNGQFLSLAALVLGFDFLIGTLTAMRMIFAGLEDTRATLGMNRIRNSYVRISPVVERFFITGVHDDAQGMLKTLSVEGMTPAGYLGLTLSTSGTMVGLINSLVGGVFAAAIVLGLGGDGFVAVLVGAIVFVVLMVVLMFGAVAYLRRRQSLLDSRFPTPATDSQPPTA